MGAICFSRFKNKKNQYTPNQTEPVQFELVFG